MRYYYVNLRKKAIDEGTKAGVKEDRHYVQWLRPPVVNHLNEQAV